MAIETAGEIPTTLKRATDPAWMTMALSGVTGGARVSDVKEVEVLRGVATKARVVVTFEDPAQKPIPLCIKGFLDAKEGLGDGSVNLYEADFYTKLAPELTLRAPSCVAVVVDRKADTAMMLLTDLVVAGAHFCSALEPFTLDDVADTLEQLARLHASHDLLRRNPWVRRHIDRWGEEPIVAEPQLQEMMNGPRGEPLDARTRSAGNILRGMNKLAALDRGRQHVLIHGDTHAGNIFRTKAGFAFTDWQLMQAGGRALDLGYHIPAVLPVELAEANERALLQHYLDVTRSLTGDAPSWDEVWRQYRESAVYGFFLWASTRFVKPEILHTFVARLGAAVMRHETYDLLGI